MTVKGRWTIAAAAVFAAAWCDASAQSNLAIYGTVDTALVYSSNQNGTSNTYVRSGNLAATKLGFRGTEDLGGGTQALFVLENGFDLNSGITSPAGFAFSRLAYVGLGDSSYGTLTAGRQYTPYYLFVGGPLGPTNVVTGATGAHPGDIDGFDTTIRANNSLSYTSPVWSGAQVGALMGLGEQAGSLSSGRSLSAAVRYDAPFWNFALGYLKLKNGNTPGVWSPTASASFSTSPINNGYVSADSVQYMAAAVRYTVGELVLGVHTSNVTYRPGSSSLFGDTARFGTVGLIASYPLSPAVFFGAGYSYTRERAANGITDPAKYQQLSLEQTYSFSKRTAFYFLEAFQVAKGRTLGAAGAGNMVNAVALVGDSQNSLPSSGRNQTVLMVGLRHSF